VLRSADGSNLMKNPPPPFVVGETYLDREGEYVVISIAGNDITYERTDGRQLHADAELKARIHRNMQLELGDHRSFRGRRIRFDGRRPVGFTFSEVFPLVASEIRSRSKSRQEFVTHEELVATLIEHPELRLVLEQLEEHDPTGKASSMVGEQHGRLVQSSVHGRSIRLGRRVRTSQGGRKLGVCRQGGGDQVERVKHRTWAGGDLPAPISSLPVRRSMIVALTGHRSVSAFPVARLPLVNSERCSRDREKGGSERPRRVFHPVPPGQGVSPSFMPN